MPAKFLIININPKDRFDDLEIFKYIKHAEPNDFPPSVMSERNTVCYREDAKRWVKDWQMDLTESVGTKKIKEKYEDDRGMVLTRTKWTLRLADRKGTLIKAGLDEDTITRLINELVDFVYDKYDAESNIYTKGNNNRRDKNIEVKEDGTMVFDYD